MPSGTILCVDQRFSDWFGRPPAEIVGKPFACLAHDQQELQQVGAGLVVLPAVLRACVRACVAASVLQQWPMGLRSTGPKRLSTADRLVLLQVLDSAERASEEDFARGLVGARGVRFVHKYTEGVQVDVAVEMGGGRAHTAATTQHLLLTCCSIVAIMQRCVQKTWLTSLVLCTAPSCCPHLAPCRHGHAAAAGGQDQAQQLLAAAPAGDGPARQHHVHHRLHRRAAGLQRQAAAAHGPGTPAAAALLAAAPQVDEGAPEQQVAAAAMLQLCLTQSASCKCETGARHGGSACRKPACRIAAASTPCPASPACPWSSPPTRAPAVAACCWRASRSAAARRARSSSTWCKLRR